MVAVWKKALTTLPSSSWEILPTKPFLALQNWPALKQLLKTTVLVKWHQQHTDVVLCVKYKFPSKGNLAPMQGKQPSVLNQE